VLWVYFRTADLRADGDHLYTSVIRYLRTDMAPQLFGANAGADNLALFTAAAAMTEMTEWIAHDAGRDATARRHFGEACRAGAVAMCPCAPGSGAAGCTAGHGPTRLLHGEERSSSGDCKVW
jgi:hypothetical protein